jgi:hypothetical protein
MDTPQKISEDEMYEALGQAFRGDPEQSLVWQLTERVTDPLKPQGTSGRRRLHPLVLVLGILALIMIGTFVYYGVFHP